MTHVPEPSEGWFYSTDRRTQVGPVPFDQLVELARSGRLAPADLVRRNRADPWQPAGAVEGLFGSPRPPASPPAAVLTPAGPAPTTPGMSGRQPAPPPVGQPDGGRTTPSALAGALFHPVAVVLSLGCCFPVGLALVWMNPSWSVARKGVWTGGWAAWMGVWAAAFALLALAASGHREAVRKSLDEADRLWADGRADEAVGKYEAVLDGGVSSVDEGRRPAVFQRVVEHEVGRGNTSVAKRYVEKAETYRVALASDVPAVKSLLAEAKAEREAAERKRQADAEAGRTSAAGLPEFITLRDGTKCRTANALVHERAFALLRSGMTPAQVRTALGEEPSAKRTDEKGNVFWVYKKSTTVGLAFGSRGDFKGRLGFLVIDGQIVIAGDADLKGN